MPPVDGVIAERERCAIIAESLAEKWEASAASLRSKYTRTPRWFGKPYTAPTAEYDARVIKAAASGLRKVASLIRSGAEIPTP